MSVIPFPIISGVRSVSIGEAYLSNFFRYEDSPLTEPSWREMAEHTLAQANKYAQELAVRNRAYQDLQIQYAKLAQRNRELEKREVTLAEVLRSFMWWRK